MVALIEFRGQDLLEEVDGLYRIRVQLTAGFAEPVSVRGIDTVVPGLRGRVLRNRVADVRTLHLEGYVAGWDAEGWRMGTDILMSVLDTEADPGDLVIRGPYLGLPDGQSATIRARTLNAVGGPISALLFQRWDIQLEAIEVDWAMGGSGS